uniref:Sulfhydryl oxidase n=1 Tax=Setaria digitata TaxID=48799 RepID=A0A915Q3M6_9BILA
MSTASSNTGEEHCRACLSVEELLKRARKLAGKVPSASRTQNSSTGQASLDRIEMKSIRRDCPVTTEKLGKSTWNLLHTIAAYYPLKPTSEQKKNAKTLMDLLGKLVIVLEMYPCSHCAEDLRCDLAEHPPNVEDREGFSLWMCGLHNRVNKKLEKPEFDCSKWKERWLNGWKDGSCEY